MSTDRDFSKQEMCYPRGKGYINIYYYFYFEIKIYLIREFQKLIYKFTPNSRGLHTTASAPRMYFLSCRQYSHLSFELIPMDRGQF